VRAKSNDDQEPKVRSKVKASDGGSLAALPQHSAVRLASPCPNSRSYSVEAKPRRTQSKKGGDGKPEAYRTGRGKAAQFEKLASMDMRADS